MDLNFKMSSIKVGRGGFRTNAGMNYFLQTMDAAN